MLPMISSLMLSRYLINSSYSSFGRVVKYSLNYAPKPIHNSLIIESWKSFLIFSFVQLFLLMVSILYITYSFGSILWFFNSFLNFLKIALTFYRTVFFLLGFYSLLILYIILTILSSVSSGWGSEVCYGCKLNKSEGLLIGGKNGDSDIGGDHRPPSELLFITDS